MTTILTSSTLCEITGIAHGFFTRKGGVSEGIYASLNCGPGSGDDEAHVEENRTRAAAAFGTDAKSLSTLYQVHGTDVITLNSPLRGDRPKADGMVTATPGVMLGILTADCAPLLFCDPEANVIGAAHVGWRPALSGIVPRTLEAMEMLGAERGRVIAAIGPAIGWQSYEVSEEFLKPFLAESAANKQFFAPIVNGKSRFDLRSYIAHKMAKAGIGLVNVLANDTYLEEDAFFSYRRKTHRNEPDYGRQLSAIMIRKE